MREELKAKGKGETTSDKSKVKSKKAEGMIVLSVYF